MTTALELLDWSEQYRDVASDGFKAEMVWLSSLSRNADHEAARQDFEHPEWVAFANKFMPLVYQVGSLAGVVKSDVYETKQLEAIKSLYTLGRVDVELDGALNEVCHSVLWSAKFGLSPFFDSTASAVVDTLMSGEITDDEFALCVVARRCLQDQTEHPRIGEILKKELTPQTYHEQLCSLVSNILRQADERR